MKRILTILFVFISLASIGQADLNGRIPLRQIYLIDTLNVNINKTQWNAYVGSFITGKKDKSDSTAAAGYATNFKLLSKENSITAGTTAQYWRGDKTFQTLNTSIVPELTNLYYTEARVTANTSVAANTAKVGYTDALARAAVSLTTTGSSGASTYSSSTGVLNVPTYTLSGLGYTLPTFTIDSVGRVFRLTLGGTTTIKFLDTNTTYDLSVYKLKSDSTATDGYVRRDRLTSSLLTKENAFSKNTAFNKDFGTTAGTVLEGRTFGTAANNATGDFEVPLTFSTGLIRTGNTITINNTVQTLTGRNTTLNVTSGLNGKHTMENAKDTINISNLLEGMTGNIEITCRASADTLVFLSSGSTVMVSPALKAVAKRIPVTNGASAIDVYSWWFANSKLIINGTKKYE